jgi:NAD(P)-dependent dehydrogenase (short-subunit alcohol dehydrogenase family)
MAGRLTQHVCLVTGATSGIGRAIAEAMVLEGAQVVGIDLQTDPTCTFEVLIADVTEEAATQRACAETFARYGRLNVLVNNAGTWAPGTVVTTELATWDRLFAVNVRGVYLTSRAAIPYMQRQQQGSIINIASNYGLVGGVNAAAYTASKGAVVTLTYAMALDHAAEGIRVNCICPGTIDTPLIQRPMQTMTQAELAAQQASRVARHPLGRIGRADEIAPGVIYLASATESSFVTGAVLAIDGGYVAR